MYIYFLSKSYSYGCTIRIAVKYMQDESKTNNILHENLLNFQDECHHCGAGTDQDLRAADEECGCAGESYEAE